MFARRSHWLLLWAFSTACTKPTNGGSGEPALDGANAAAEVEASTNSEPPDLEHTEFPLTLWAAFLAQRDYVDPKRFSAYTQLDAALAALEASAPQLFARRTKNEIRVSLGEQSKTFTIDPNDEFLTSARHLEAILSFAVPILKIEGEERHELEYAAFNGLVSVLDPHTVLLTPKQNESLGVRTRGHFGGIGAEIVADDRRIRIVRVLPDTPAQKSGVQDEDLVYQIDGRSTVNMSAREAQELLRGPIGSDVVVKVRRGKSLIEIKITRGKIDLPSVRAMLLENQTGYVQFMTFHENGANHVVAEMKKLLAEGAQSLVLDLRGNTGGLLTEAIRLVDAFVSKGELISVLSRKGREREMADESLDIPRETPLVILMNQGSASASEIVAGAMAQLNRAVVVGRSSFGKGSVQQLFPASPYGEELALKLTIAEYRVSGDTRIQGRGVKPDLSLFPMRLGDFRGVGSFFDTKIYDEVRENGVYGHASDEPKAGAEDGHALRYLARTPWDDTPNGKRTEAQRAWRDHEIRLAAQLAAEMVMHLAGTPPQRDEIARSVIPGFLEKRRAEEESALVQALKRWDIDWSAAVTNAPDVSQSLGLKLEVVSIEEDNESTSRGQRRPKKTKSASATNANGSKLRVGDIFTVRVTVQNKGSTDAHRVHLRTRYLLPELDGIETVLGKVPAGGQTSIDLRMQVAPGRSPHLGKLAFDVYTGEDAEEPSLHEELPLTLDPRPLPEFEFDYWIVDDPSMVAQAPKRPDVEPIEGEATFQVVGNGDGRVAPGERVLFVVRARNRGDGVAEIPSFVVRNRSREQALLEEGAAELPEIAPGEAKAAAVALTILPTADVSQPIDIQILVGDRKTSQVTERNVQVRIDEAARRELWIPYPKPQTLKNLEMMELRSEPDVLSPVLARLPARTQFRARGRSDSWLALEGPDSRLLWAKVEPSQVEEAKGKSALSWDAFDVMVAAPRLELALPYATEASSLTLKGRVVDDRELKDVVVWRLPEDIHATPHKIYYGELEGSQSGDDRKQMNWSAKVSLEEGYQKIRVVARDNDKVVRERDYWVFRGPASKENAGQP